MWLVGLVQGADLEAGRHLGEVVLQCQGCHGEDLGGNVMIDAFPMGRVVAGNLTTSRTPEEWNAAIRGGMVGDDPIILMPPQSAALSDEDLADLVAWLESLPDVERDLPRTKLGPVGKMLVSSGGWDSGPYPARTDGDLLTLACKSCHGDDLKGRDMGPEGFAADLTTLNWSGEEFAAAVREGKRPDGTALGEGMPRFALSDEELSQIQAALR